MANKIQIFEKLFEEINEAYRINFNDIASSLYLPVEGNGFIDFSVVDSFTPEELSKALFTTISWLDHINYKKSLIEAIVHSKQIELNTKSAALSIEIRANIQNETGKKVTNSEVESIISINEEIMGMNRKIEIYKSYLHYLEGLYKVMEILHYSVKFRLDQLNTNLRKNSF
jgi:hypothetical protein